MEPSTVSNSQQLGKYPKSTTVAKVVEANDVNREMEKKGTERTEVVVDTVVDIVGAADAIPMPASGNGSLAPANASASEANTTFAGD